MLKSCAVNLLKISGDLRLLSSGPDSGFMEIKLPSVQAGSSIMAGKVNPVIPEMVSQVAMQVMANDQIIAGAAAAGNLELNQFFPVIAWNILQSLQLLLNGSTLFRERCVDGIEANQDTCAENVINGKSIATILVPGLGYAKVEAAVKYAQENECTVAEALVKLGILTQDKIQDLLAPRRMYKLGFDPEDIQNTELS